MAEQFVIKGLQELERELSKLEKSVSGKIVMGAMRATVKPMRADIRRSTPRGKTGNLRKSVRASVRRKGRQLVVTKTGPRAPHTHLVVEGTDPHVIRPRNSRALSFRGRFLGGIDHPGARANDFLSPVYRRWERQFPVLLGFELRHRIERINFKTTPK